MSRHSYLLVINGVRRSRAQVQGFLDTKLEILNWYSIFPNAIFIISEETASQLSDIIRPFVQPDHFIILNVDTDRNGWMPRKAWDFIKNKNAI
jgi:hypothetical protein